jgi:high affinity Mn2+ porin
MTGVQLRRALAAAVWLIAPRAFAQTPPDLSEAEASDAAPTVETYAIHAQTTFTEIYQPAFRSPYRGPQSLDPGSRGRQTWDATLYGGVRPWDGAEIWADPEIDQGFGPSNTFGLGGYVSAEAYKLGQRDPYVRLQRLFFRQTIDLGGETQAVAPDQNQLGGAQTADRVVLWAGKFSSFDVFDTNKYAHDARHDFLNWSLLDAGSFDQAGDAWGFTYGAAAEWYQDWWTVRAGAFDMPTVPAYKYLNPQFGTQTQVIGELEERHALFGRDGAFKVDGFLSHGLLGSYGQALELARRTGETPDIQSVLRIAYRGGGSLNLQQALTDDLGFFARAGLADGSQSITAYTDIDNSVSFGFSLAGPSWGRPDDTAGIGFARNDISRHFKDYLRAGGLGILIGDGRLPNSGPEQLMEAYYSLSFVKGVELTADYQFVDNPAYNRDRGPVNFLGARLHAQF